MELKQKKQNYLSVTGWIILLFFLAWFTFQYINQTQYYNYVYERIDRDLVILFYGFTLGVVMVLAGYLRQIASILRPGTPIRENPQQNTPHPGKSFEK
jgi:polyferredoxin